MKDFFEVQDIVVADGEYGFSATIGDKQSNVIVTPDDVRSIKDLTIGIRSVDYNLFGPLDDFELIGSFETPPSDFGLVYTEDSGEKIGLFKFPQQSEDEPVKGIIAVTVPGNTKAKWMYAKMNNWSTVFNKYFLMVAIKLKSRGKNMITDKGPIERPLITSKPSPKDPVNQEVQKLKGVLLNLFAGGDFNLNLNLEGKQWESGDVEINGNFRVVFKVSHSPE